MHHQYQNFKFHGDWKTVIFSLVLDTLIFFNTVPPLKYMEAVWGWNCNAHVPGVQKECLCCPWAYGDALTGLWGLWLKLLYNYNKLLNFINEARIYNTHLKEFHKTRGTILFSNIQPTLYTVYSDCNDFLQQPVNLNLQNGTFYSVNITFFSLYCW